MTSSHQSTLGRLDSQKKSPGSIAMFALIVRRTPSTPHCSFFAKPRVALFILLQARAMTTKLGFCPEWGCEENSSYGDGVSAQFSAVRLDGLCGGLMLCRSGMLRALLTTRVPTIKSSGPCIRRPPSTTRRLIASGIQNARANPRRDRSPTYPPHSVSVQISTLHSLCLA